METPVNQDSVIIIIKYRDRILLRHSPRWNDISFVGGRIQKKDHHEPIRTAHRVLYEELGILGNLDFEIFTLQDAPLSFPKKNLQTGIDKMYRFYVFFAYITGDSREYLNSPNNRWVALDKIKPGFKDSLSIPISSLVLTVLPFLDLSAKDSFNYEKDRAIYKYRKEVILSIEDNQTNGFIDDIERRILERKKKELGLSEIEAKKIEHEIITSLSQDNNVEIQDFHIIKDAISKENLYKDLQYYARSKRYIKLKIKNVFSEGKTGALVFQVQGTKGNEKVSRILKYDFYMRIQKEYRNFIENERLHGIFASPKCEQYIMGQFGFLELQPADDFANAKDMSSFRQYAEKKIHEISDSPHTKTQLFDALREILKWLFHKVYKSEGDSYLEKKEPYQNTIDQFLPPRWVLQGKIMDTGNTIRSKNYFRVPKKNIISYDVLNNFNTGQTELTAKVWFTQKGTNFVYRSDVRCSLEPEQVAILGEVEQWELYVSQGGGEFKRKTFFQEIHTNARWLWPLVKKFELYPAFNEIKSKNRFDMGFAIDKLLQQTGKTYQTECLHGDFNPSNLLFCRSDVNKFYPILIDFYDTGVRGNLFYDLARLEIELVISLLSPYLNRVLGVPQDCDSLGESEVDFILTWEENLFDLNPSALFTGDYMILELRNIVYELMAGYLPQEFRKFHWLKNYFLAVGVFGIGFQKFKRESNLNRFIALIWALKAFYRFDNMEAFMEGSLSRLTAEQFVQSNTATPLEKLRIRCNKANKLYEIEHGSLQVNPDLFIDYYSRIKQDMDAYLTQEDKNIFFLIDETGSGKSWFINFYFSNEKADFPVLYVQGSQDIKDELGFVNQVQVQLNTGNDWAHKINEVDLKDSPYSFCIILDNFSDNSNSKITAQALKTLLKRVKDTKIKIIAIGEPWFWYDFLDKDELIFHEAFRIYNQTDRTKYKLFSAMETPSGVDGDLLIQEYFRYYRINGELFGSAIDIAKNPGYLKQFCEVMEGKNFGKIDNVLAFDIMESYIDKKHHEIGNETGLLQEDIERVIYHISEKMYSSNPNQIPITEVMDSTREELPDISYTKMVDLVKSAMKYKYFLKHSTLISFTFPEIPSFLLAAQLVKNWQQQSKTNELAGLWLEKNLDELEIPNREVLTIYILRNLHDLSDKNYFYSFVKKIASHLKNKPVPVLRILSKTLPGLPTITSNILEILYRLEFSLQAMEKEQDDNKELQDEASLFRYRMDNIDFGKESQSWFKLVETREFPKIASFISSFTSDQMNQLTRYLAEVDSKYGERFFRNFLKPIFPIFSQHLSEYEEFQYQKILELSRNILINYNVNSDYEFVLHIYQIINQVATTKIENLREAVLLFTERKIEDLNSLLLTDEYIQSWIQIYAYDLDIKKFLYEKWIDFIIKNHFYMRNEIDYEGYKILLTLIPSKESYHALPCSDSLKDRLLQYARSNLPATLTLMKILIADSSELKIRFQQEIKKQEENFEEQAIVQVLFRIDEKILLQYKPKWNDYSWIGAQVTSHNEEEARKQSMDALAEKLNLKPEKEFDILKTFIKPRPFENFSRTRRKVIRYYPMFFIGKLESHYLLDKLLANENNRFFSISELQERGKWMISQPVKQVIPALIDNWQELDNSID